MCAGKCRAGQRKPRRKEYGGADFFKNRIGRVGERGLTHIVTAQDADDFAAAVQLDEEALVEVLDLGRWY